MSQRWIILCPTLNIRQKHKQSSLKHEINALNSMIHMWLKQKWRRKSNSAFYSKDEKKRSQTTSCHQQNKTFNGKHVVFLGQFQTSYSTPIFNARIHGFPFATMCLQAGFNANTSYSIHPSFFFHWSGVSSLFQGGGSWDGPRPAERPGSPTAGTGPEHVTRDTRAVSWCFWNRETFKRKNIRIITTKNNNPGTFSADRILEK